MREGREGKGREKDELVFSHVADLTTHRYEEEDAEILLNVEGWSHE